MKRNGSRNLLSVVLGVFAVSAIAAGTLAVSVTPAAAIGGCVCPQIYDPVICSKGQIYPNQCVADCHHAKGCVPYGAF
jgi:uncharacterized membrane protein